MMEWWSGLPETQAALALIAAFATLLLAVQLLMSIFGSDTDMDLDDTGDVAAFLSIRNLGSFLVGLSYVGLGLGQMGLPTALALIAGLGVGVGAVWVNIKILRLLGRMQTKGNWELNAIPIGTPAEVSIEIGAKRQSSGKITLLIDGSRREIEAVTDFDTALHRHDTVEVSGYDGGQILVSPDLKSKLQSL